jgi:hypothetical protein
MRRPKDVTFGAWLSTQADRTDAVGDLARAYREPCNCPACAGRTSRRYSVAGVREEFRRHSAKPTAFAALETAESEWRQGKGDAA